MSNDVTAGSANTLRVLPLRLVAMKFAALSKPNAMDLKQGQKSTFDEVLDGFSLEVLANAYVILIQTGSAMESIGSGATPIIARTTSDGTLRRIEAPEVDGDVPDQTKTISFEPGSRFAFFWTRDKELFKATLASVQKDSAAALVKHPFSHVQLTPHRHAHYYAGHGHQDLGAVGKAKMSAASRFKLELLLYDFDGDFNKTLVHGVFRGHEFSPLQVSGTDAKASYAVARSDALAAVYIAELVNRQTVAERMKTWEDWQFLQGALDTASQAINFGHAPEFREQFATFQFAGQTWNRDPKILEGSYGYLKFVYDCAAAGVERGLVYDSLRWPPHDWKEAALEIRSKHGIVHPSLKTQYYVLHYEKGVQNYYDFYEWGFAQKKEKWPAQVSDVATKIDAQIDDVRKRLASFLGRRAPYLRFMAEIAAHLPPGAVAPRKALHRNYLDVSLFNRYDFWGELGKLESDHEWEQIKQYLSWVASLNDKLGELFGEFFGDPLVAMAFNEALKENAGRFEALFANMTKFEKRFGNKVKERTHPDGTVFEADFKNNVVRIKKPGQAEEIIEGFTFLVVSEETTVQVQQVVPGRKGNAFKKRIRKVTKTDTIHNVQVTSGLKNVHRWPAFMATFGDTVAFVFTMSELYAAVKRERVDVEMVGKVGRDTFQAVSSVGTALNVLRGLPQKSWLLKTVRVAGPAGAFLEAVFNVNDGLTILFSEDSPAYKNEGTVVGTLYFAKGWVLVGSVAGGATIGMVGAVSAIAAGGSMAAASAAFFTPLGVALAVGAVVVVGIEIAVFVYNGPTSSMEGYDDKLEEVREDEFEDRAVSRTFENLAAFQRDANRVLTLLES